MGRNAERRSRWGVLAVIALGLRGPTAVAATPGQLCQAAKNVEAGAYAACRQRAEGRFAVTGDAGRRTADLGRCATKLQQKWSRLEAKAAGKSDPCPSVNDQETIRGLIDVHATTLAAALGGMPLPDCAAERATCASDLTNCGTDRAACMAALPGMQTTQATCAANLATCSTDLASAQANAANCTADLGACAASLSTAQTALPTCTADLAACESALSTGQSNLATCEGERATCVADLATCASDLADCEAIPKGQPLRTGQTLCYTAGGGTIACANTGLDGEVLAGMTRSYTDNADGTITDHRTGLVWEKLSNDGSIHDVDDTYTWATARSSKIASLNASSFAGHTDWRLPSPFELESLLDFGAYNPSVPSNFNATCTASCTVLACSCTAPSTYWTSTTQHSATTQAWTVNFIDGRTSTAGKGTLRSVRAVRGGV